MSSKPDPFDAEKALSEIKSLITELPAATRKAIEQKSNDIPNSVALCLQSFGFLILLGSRYFQNQRKVDWEYKQDELRQIWDANISAEISTDVLEFAANTVALDNLTNKSNSTSVDSLRLKFLKELAWQPTAYWMNARKMFHWQLKILQIS